MRPAQFSLPVVLTAFTSASLFAVPVSSVLTLVEDGVNNKIAVSLGIPTISGNTMTFTLPLGGSAGDLFVEGSETLKPGEWSDLAGGSVSGGVNPIPGGTTGTVTVTLPAGLPVHGVRLRASYAGAPMMSPIGPSSSSSSFPSLLGLSLSMESAKYSGGLGDSGGSFISPSSMICMM